MKVLRRYSIKFRQRLCAVLLIKDSYGQDLIEYALLTGLVSLLVGAILPERLVAPLTVLYGRVTDILGLANSGGGT
jgi:Flp pilus assembly pilin Flp